MRWPFRRHSKSSEMTQDDPEYEVDEPPPPPDPKNPLTPLVEGVVIRAREKAELLDGDRLQFKLRLTKEEFALCLKAPQTLNSLYALAISYGLELEYFDQAKGKLHFHYHRR